MTGETRTVTRMTRAALEDEVQRLRRVDRQLRVLHRIDTTRSGDLLKTAAALRAAQRDATEQRRLRVEAETNAKRFHAMMIQARIQLIEKKGTAA